MITILSRFYNFGEFDKTCLIYMTAMSNQVNQFHKTNIKLQSIIYLFWCCFPTFSDNYFYKSLNCHLIYSLSVYEKCLKVLSLWYRQRFVSIEGEVYFLAITPIFIDWIQWRCAHSRPPFVYILMALLRHRFPKIIQTLNIMAIVLRDWHSIVSQI